jgi:hypothetical protein
MNEALGVLETTLMVVGAAIEYHDYESESGVR